VALTIISKAIKTKGDDMKQRRGPVVVVRARRSGTGQEGITERSTEQPSERARAEPTPQRLRHAAGDFEHGHSGQITMRDSPIERLLARSVITQEQYAAAQKYRHHWFHAGLSDRLGSLDLDRVPAHALFKLAPMAPSERQVFHRQQYREAVQAVGKLGSHVLDWAVCREVALDRVGETLGWSTRPQAYAAAAERLKMALDELCRLWGIGN
jgi:hypothetical protein